MLLHELCISRDSIDRLDFVLMLILKRDCDFRFMIAEITAVSVLPFVSGGANDGGEGLCSFRHQSMLSNMTTTVHRKVVLVRNWRCPIL